MLLHDSFEFHARGRGDACFSIFEGQTLTYRDAQARCVAMSGAMLREGVRAGDRVALLGRNSADYLLLILAVSRIGAVVVPLNYRLAPSEWANLLRDAGAVMIIADADFAPQYEPRTAGPDEGHLIATFLVDESILGWATLLRPSTDVPTSALQRPSPQDTVVQMYTSGTTGRAKGALLSHSALVHNIGQGLTAFPYRLNPGERMLAVLPLFHIAALVTVFGAIAAGGCLVIHRDVNPVAIAESLAHDRIVSSCLVPAVIQFLLTGVPGIEEMHFPDLKYLAYGASPIAEPVLRRAMSLFRCDLAQGYGMTEMAGIVSMLTEADHARALRDRPDLLLSAGKAVPGTEIRIVDGDGADAAAGEIGEVLVRGGQMMLGYWNMPDETAATFRGGWLHTGDAGVLDAEGYLFLRDRVKDMIISGAENIYPVEIEQVLFSHPAVADASVIGVPDDRWGEAVMAVVVARSDASLSAADLEAYCRLHLGSFKVPRRYAFVEALPRNAAGKVLKRQLREQYRTPVEAI